MKKARENIQQPDTNGMFTFNHIQIRGQDNERKRTNISNIVSNTVIWKAYEQK